MATNRIAALFRVPDGYRRELRFYNSGTDFGCAIVVTPDGLKIDQNGVAGGNVCSMCVDWIAEVITHMRMEVGDL